MIATEFTDGITDQATREATTGQTDTKAIPPDAIARGILYAIGQ